MRLLRVDILRFSERGIARVALKKQALSNVNSNLTMTHFELKEIIETYPLRRFSKRTNIALLAVLVGTIPAVLLPFKR